MLKIAGANTVNLLKCQNVNCFPLWCWMGVLKLEHWKGLESLLKWTSWYLKSWKQFKHHLMSKRWRKIPPNSQHLFPQVGFMLDVCHSILFHTITEGQRENLNSTVLLWIWSWGLFQSISTSSFLAASREAASKGTYPLD